MRNLIERKPFRKFRSLPAAAKSETLVELITATQAKIRHLYHYQPFDQMRLAKVVTDRTLYFSNPKDFNDPWDCRPWYDWASLADPAVLERHIQWYVKVTRKHMPEILLAEVSRRASIFASNPELLRTKIEDLSASMEAAIQDRYRVLCLGSSPECELMWAHYAAKHSGICLEFSTRNETFSGALRVSYREDYPRLDLTSDKDADNLATLLTKSAAWRYEREYRLIAQEKNSRADGSATLLTNDNLIQMPGCALTAVIAGCLAPDSVVSAIKKMICNSGQSVSVKRAVRARDKYKIVIDDA